MQSWIPLIDGMPSPKYLAIAEALAKDIQSGILAAGARLPTQRTLAQALGLDLTTVTRAYGEAQRMGLIEGSGRRGSFVRASAPRSAGNEIADPGDPGMNAPPDAFGGSLLTEFRKSAESLLTSQLSPAPFLYQQSGGTPSVRQAGAHLLTSRGIPCDEDTVLVAAGGQHALHAIFSAELRPGDTIAVCQFVYPGMLALARRFSIRLQVIASDGEGMQADSLEAACSATTIRAVYIVPTNDNPTTTTMSIERRAAIAAVVDRYCLILIEDDAYGLLPEHPLPPISSLAPEHAWHVASVSKVLAPGLRVAWLRAPDVGRAWRLAADMHETAIMAAPLNAAIVADWISTGTLPRLVGEVRHEARQRQALACDCLPIGSFRGHDDGYHIWMPLDADTSARHVADSLRKFGISAITSEAFAADATTAAPALRLSLGGTISQDKLLRGLHLLAALIGPDASRKISLV